jgi:hypothetical protein
MISEAINILYPSAVYVKERGGVISAEDKDYNNITLDMAAVNTKAAELQVIEDYQEPRRRAYPSLQDQADMRYHDAVNGTTTWQDAIKAVKDKYPKE